MKAKSCIIVLILVLFLWGCTSLSKPIPTSTPTLLPSPTSSNTPYPMPVLPIVTATKAPTPTSTVTLIPWPTLPERPLDDNGPWIMASSEDGYYVMNMDGTGMTRFFEKDPNFTYQVEAISSASGYIAILKQPADNSNWEENWYNQSLLVISIKEGKLLHTLPLTNRDITYPDWGSNGVDGADLGSSTWSPAGPYLAYIAASDGPSADVYLYSVPADQYYQMTSGPAQTNSIAWSPDGKYIYNTGVHSFGSGGPIPMAGVWLVTTTGETTLLSQPDSFQSEEVIDWLSPHTFITNSGDAGCGGNKLRSYNIDTREEIIYWAQCFHSVLAYETTTPSFILQFGDTGSEDIYEQYSDVPVGIYFASQDKKVLLTTNTRQRAFWIPDGYYILGSPETGYKAFNSAGEDITSSLEIPIPTNFPSDFNAYSYPSYILLDGTWIYQDSTLIKGSDTPRQLVPGAQSVIRNPSNGDLLIYAENPTPSLYIARAPDYTLYSSPAKLTIDWMFDISP